MHFEWVWLAAGVAAFGMLSGGMFAQAPAAQRRRPGHGCRRRRPTMLPNPYNTIEGWAKLPEGRTWGSTSAVEIDKDGRSIWVAERCAANSCWDRAKGEMSPLQHRVQVRSERQDGDELRPGHVRLPARHPRRSRRQRLGDRRPEQPAGARARVSPPTRRCRRCRRRWSATRWSSSAPRARCC